MATRFTQVSILLQFQAPVRPPLRLLVVFAKSHDITKELKLFRTMQMHNKMEGCFVTAPTTPWAGKELWYKQCGRDKNDIFLKIYQVTGNIYVFLVYASRSLFALFDDGSLQAFKREREQDYLHFRMTANFSQRHLSSSYLVTLLEFSSLDIPLFGFSTLYTGLCFFSGPKGFFIILHGQEMEGTE